MSVRTFNFRILITAMRFEKILFISACVLGFLFSLWVQVSQSASLCLQQSCAAFANFTFFGLSMWVLAMAYFAFCALLALLKKVRALGVILALGGLCEFALLALMAALFPCLYCLIQSVIAFAAIGIYVYSQGILRRFTVQAVMGLFVVLLSMNAGFYLRDTSSPWPLAGDESAKVHIYFSPSCKSCSQLMAQFALESDIAWHPVAEYPEDIAFVAEMQKFISQGVHIADAYQIVLSDPPKGRLAHMDPRYIRLQYHLWKNEAHLVRSGTNLLPHLEFYGIPAFLENRPKSNFFKLPGNPFAVKDSCAIGEGRDCE